MAGLICVSLGPAARALVVGRVLSLYFVRLALATPARFAGYVLPLAGCDHPHPSGVLWDVSFALLLRRRLSWPLRERAAPRSSGKTVSIPYQDTIIALGRGTWIYVPRVMFLYVFLRAVWPHSGERFCCLSDLKGAFQTLIGRTIIGVD